jgi:hypothetical protein
MEVIDVEDQSRNDDPARPEFEDSGQLEFREVDPERFCSALEGVLAKFPPQERLLGKVDEHGDIIWGGCPRAMFEPEYVPWLASWIYGRD